MNKKSKETIGFIFFFLSFIAIQILIIFLGMEFNKTIQYVENFTATSKSEGFLEGKYTTTIRGEIKNNTKNDIINATLTFYLKTSFLGYTGSITTEPFSIKSGENLRLNQEFATTENFEEIERVILTIDGTETEIKNDNMTLTYLISVVVVILYLIIGMTIFKSKQQPRQTINPYTLQNNQITEEQEIYHLKNTIEKEKLKNELSKTTPKTCAYCGHKNVGGATKCDSCGAPL